MDVFNFGQRIRAEASITDGDGAAADPSGGVFVVVKEPRSPSVTYEYNTDPEVIKDATGEYYIDLTLSASGVWALRWYTEGDLVVSSGDIRFRVRETVTDA